MPALNKAARAALVKERVNSFEVSVVLVSDKEIKKLNRKFRNVNRITDVISFKFISDVIPVRRGGGGIQSFRRSRFPITASGMTRIIGDIYISEGRSKKQAAEVGNTWIKELSYLVIHGVLHLLGYSDYTKHNRRKMFKIQDEIFGEIVGNSSNP